MTNMKLPTTAAEFETTWADALSSARTTYETLAQSQEGTLHDFDRMFAAAEQVSAPASLFSNVHPDVAVREIAERLEQTSNQLLTEISLDKRLYELLAKIDVSGASALHQRFHERLMRDFRRAGVDKSEAERARITELRAELVEIGQNFEKNIREDVRSITVQDLRGLPADFIEAHKPDADGSIKMSSGIAPIFLTYLLIFFQAFFLNPLPHT